MISGRKCAPGLLGAYFNQISGAQVGIGHYESVDGTPDAPGPAEQTLIGVVQVAAPAGPYTVWADRSGTGSFVETAPKNRLLYVLNDLQISASEKMIGEPPAYIAVLTDRPGDSGIVNAAFADSRYKWSKTEAIYSQADQNRVPKMTFLHWAELRAMSDWKGRTESEQRASNRLGGTLVFPVALAASPSDRGAPQATFDDAFAAQFPTGGQFLPRVVSAPTSETQAIAQQEAAKSSLTVLAIIGCGALAAWAGYKATRTMRGQTA